MGDISFITVIFKLLGGLGIFLLGMQFMSEGLQKSAGEKLKKIIEKLSINRVVGTGVGAFVTTIIQSSSATTVMVVGFVNAGLMGLTQALSVILGANIGTTITAQIISFKVTSIAMPCIGIGAILFIFIKKPAVQYIGQTILGFGLLFLGMELMTQAFKPLAASSEFRNVFIYFSQNPVAAVMAGALTTLVVQSSSATMGITLSLAATGVIDFYAAAALVLGENIGTTITANIAALSAGRIAKQAAFGHFLFNAIGVGYMLLFLPYFVSFVDFITDGMPNSPDAIERHIANFHTMFNIINTVVFLPILPLLAKICEKIIPADESYKDKAVHLSDAVLSTPEIAVGLAQQETGRMFKIAVNLFNDAKNIVISDDNSYSINKSKELLSVLHTFNNEIHTFILKLSSKPLSVKSLADIHTITSVIEEVNQIGERSAKLIKTKYKMYDKNIQFSDTAKNELETITKKVDNFTNGVYNIYNTDSENRDLNQLIDLIKEEDDIDQLRKTYKKNHLKRVDNELCTVPIGLIFIELLNTLEKIADNTYTIAQSMMDDNNLI